MFSETKSHHPGFTLIELLIVIVVIAILAAIAVVAYRGIQTRAAESGLKSDLRTASKELAIAKTEDGDYPGDDSSLSKSPNTNYEYDMENNSYCLTATSTKNSNAKAFHVKNGGAIQEGPCEGHSGPSTGGGGSGGTIADGTPIQNMTQSHCSNLAVYDGTNESALITLTDSRGGTTRSYTVGKLADNKCWMLDNLKLGSTSGTITLTPADSDVNSNFTLPQLYNSTSNTKRDHDNPKAYGPVPGDTGSGATNYGYLYNWSAATAGESRTSHNQNAGNAPHSICPKGWRLPTGGGGANTDFGDLDIAFGGNGSYASSGANIAKWNHSGPLRGVLAGAWWSGFSGPGGRGDLWSGSAHPGDADSAFVAYFGAGGVNPDYSYGRFYGVGVRCLLN